MGRRAAQKADKRLHEKKKWLDDRTAAESDSVAFSRAYKKLENFPQWSTEVRELPIGRDAARRYCLLLRDAATLRVTNHGQRLI